GQAGFVRKSVALAVLIAVAGFLIAGVASLRAEPPAKASPAHHLRHGFRNLDTTYRFSISERAQRMLRRTIEGWPARGALPAVLSNDGAALRANGTVPTVTWIRHSTLLVQLGGVNIRTAPNSGARASPGGFGRPRRCVAPGPP